VRTVTAGEAPLRIGRGSHNDLVLDRPGVGRDHLVLEVRDGAWWAVPGTAPGGTLLDGARVEEPVPLHGTGLLELGRGVRIRVTVEGG
jgi:pSer/pThr/pTyr-binding forkhead associated (FHA) protein